MKYLVVLVVIMVAIGLWRNRRANDASSHKAPEPPRALAQDILACAHCGVHVPKTDALMLGNQPYCSEEHRQLGSGTGSA